MMLLLRSCGFAVMLLLLLAVATDVELLLLFDEAKRSLLFGLILLFNSLLLITLSIWTIIVRGIECL